MNSSKNTANNQKERSRAERKDNLEKYYSIQSEIEILYELLDLPEILSLTADENRLITAKELLLQAMQALENHIC